MRKPSHWFLVLLFTFFIGTLIVQATPTQPLVEAQNTITTTKLLNTLRVLAHPNFNGRGTSDGGYDLPSKFIAREFKRYGLKPLGDTTNPQDPLSFGETRSYFQAFDAHSWISGKKIPSRNVVGMIEGESKEIIVIGAHYDHMGGNFPGREIYYGADDNASGTTAVLAIAEALSMASKHKKPQRSFLIGLWGAEEHGLLGSEYFVRHLPPEIQLNDIVTVINLDMVGRNADNELFCIMAPKKLDYSKVSPELYTLTQTLAKQFGFTLTYTNDGFTASDQASFFGASPANKRIPIIFYFSGFHPDYHEITDTYDKINYPKLTRIAQMAFTAAWNVSEMNGRPTYRDNSLFEEQDNNIHWRGCNH